MKINEDQLPIVDYVAETILHTLSEYFDRVTVMVGGNTLVEENIPHSQIYSSCRCNSCETFRTVALGFVSRFLVETNGFDHLDFVVPEGGSTPYLQPGSPYIGSIGQVPLFIDEYEVLYLTRGFLDEVCDTSLIIAYDYFDDDTIARVMYATNSRNTIEAYYKHITGEEGGVEQAFPMADMKSVPLDEVTHWTEPAPRDSRDFYGI